MNSGYDSSIIANLSEIVDNFLDREDEHLLYEIKNFGKLPIEKKGSLLGIPGLYCEDYSWANRPGYQIIRDCLPKFEGYKIVSPGNMYLISEIIGCYEYREMARRYDYDIRIIIFASERDTKLCVTYNICDISLLEGLEKFPLVDEKGNFIPIKGLHTKAIR